MSIEAFSRDQRESVDMIFLDADHTYAAVKRDTEILLPLLSPTGIFVWHDYANWGSFSRQNGVPEFLHEFSEAVSSSADLRFVSCCTFPAVVVWAGRKAFPRGNFPGHGRKAGGRSLDNQRDAGLSRPTMCFRSLS